MPDYNARKRLKKRMLDRWENEGGRIAPDSTTPPDTNEAKNPDSEGNRPLASRDKSEVGGPAIPTKKRRLTQK